MTKYRIAVQSIDGNKFKHVHNIMFETDNIDLCINNVRDSIDAEISLRKELTKSFFYNKNNFIKKMIKSTDKDLIDWVSKGNDVSKEEFLENEIFFETR